MGQCRRAVRICMMIETLVKHCTSLLLRSLGMLSTFIVRRLRKHYVYIPILSTADGSSGGVPSMASEPGVRPVRQTHTCKHARTQAG